MPKRHVIVDGSNLATEGRTMPSLAQLDQAVREFIAENPGDDVTVVVDASFGHRIDPSELPDFEKAEAAGEVVSPPAGAIGRGDAFLLRIAEKVGATVLSNDSFQEFHGEHAWLFDKGRLVGGKPVPGVGWIFMDRTPVRGAKSREVVKEAKRRKHAEATPPEPAPPETVDARSKSRPKAVDRAIASATKEIVAPSTAKRSSRRRSGQPPAEAVNEPLAFITFIAAHPLGSEVVGTVVEYSSHGAFVDADGARCYMPLSAMAEPPPRRAREVVTKGEQRTFAVQAFDPQRRGVELAIPGFARIAGEPTPETVEAEIHTVPPVPAASKRPASKKPAAKRAPASKKPAATKGTAKKAATGKPAAKEAPAKKAAANKEPAAGRAKKAAAEVAAPAKKAAAAAKSAAKKASAAATAAKKAAPKKAAAKKAPAKKAVEEAPAKKAAAKKAPAKRSPAKKQAAG
jgi:hypothetical protein